MCKKCEEAGTDYTKVDEVVEALKARMDELHTDDSEYQMGAVILVFDSNGAGAFKMKGPYSVIQERLLAVMRRIPGVSVISDTVQSDDRKEVQN